MKKIFKKIFNFLDYIVIDDIDINKSARKKAGETPPPLKEYNTLVCNLLAGPGVGKSIFCASLFAKLKRKGIGAEQALEWVKDEIYQENYKILENQFYVFGQQCQRIRRLNSKVQVIITDSPVLLSVVYDAQRENSKYFKDLILEEHAKYRSLNIFLERTDYPYEQIGRMQDIEGAKILDKNILDTLDSCGIKYEKILAEEKNEEYIIELILNQLKK